MSYDSKPERGGNLKIQNPYSFCALVLPLLEKGDRGAVVRTLQLLLIGNGYDCGYRGDDGVFGNRTKQALCRFQRERDLAVSGRADKESWWALLTSPVYEEVIF